MCTVDFEKAFNSVEHAALWALSEQGVDGQYIRLLAKFYNNQAGKIQGPPQSKSFRIQRGTKQGDPMSPKLFNAVSEMVFRNIQKQGSNREFGVPVSGRLLCNLRLADDVIILEMSKDELG